MVSVGEDYSKQYDRVSELRDIYRTIAAPAEAIYKERSSKFLAYAYPVESEEEVKVHLDKLRKEYFDATHHCYAYRIGAEGEQFRANDDGEPSGTAGKPILGQLLSSQLTNCLVVVVRYFGGTKLGVSGLIQAYKESTAEVLAASDIIEKTVDTLFEVEFPYIAMNGVQRVIKEVSPRIDSQNFDNLCTMTLRVRKSEAPILEARLRKVEGVSVEEL